MPTSANVNHTLLDHAVSLITRRAEILIRAAKSYSGHRCAILAGGVTYYALVSLFPLILFALSIAGFIWRDPAEQKALIDNLLSALPLDAQSGRSDLEQLVRSVVRARGALGLIGLVGAAYTGSSLFAAIRVALNQVFEVDDTRPFLRAKVIDLALVLGFGALLLLSIAATFAIAIAARFASEVVGTQGGQVVRWSSVALYVLLPTAVSGLIFLLLYSKVARADVSWRTALGGVLTATLAFEALKVAFAEYVAAFGNYDATYGTLGFLVILLLFFFFSAQVMLFGAEVVRADREYARDPRTRELAALRDRAQTLRRRIPFFQSDASGSTSPAPDLTRMAAPSAPAVDVPTHPATDPPSERASPGDLTGRLPGIIYALTLGALTVLAVVRARRRS